MASAFPPAEVSPSQPKSSWNLQANQEDNVAVHTEGPSPRVSLSQTLWAVKLPIQFNQTYVSHTLKDGSVVKNLPMDQSLVWKDLTCCRASKPVGWAVEPVGSNY